MAGKQQQTKTLATALRFIASLVFLYVVFVSPPSNTSAGVSAAALWVPIAWAVAVVGSVALFFSSLVGFGWSTDTMGAGKWVMYTTLALLTWAVIAGGAALSTTVELILVGFIIGWFGGVVEK